MLAKIETSMDGDYSSATITLDAYKKIYTPKKKPWWLSYGLYFWLIDRLFDITVEVNDDQSKRA